MKKVFIILVLIFLCLFISCNKSEKEDDTQKLTINYYYNDELILTDTTKGEIKLLDYTKSGYTFYGWYLDKELTQEFNKDNTSEYKKIGTINLYAKMEKDMKDLSIKIVGRINGEIVVNPLFTWDNVNKDTSFTCELLLDGEVIDTVDTDKTFVQFSRILKSDTKYTVTVEGKESQKKTKIDFNTIKDYKNTILTFTLANPFSDGMVIQRDTECIVSGTGPVRQLIIVKIDDEMYYSVSDENGHFDITIPSHSASFDPVNMIISNGSTAKMIVTDILFGDVYLFAGQSNMQWPTQNSDYTSSDIEKLTSSSVRFFAQDVVTSTEKLESVKNGRWFKPNGVNTSGFSAIATITGALLGSTIVDAPIGIVTAYQGDTNIANWMGEEYYKGSCSTKYLHYNAMVYPLRSTKLSGVVWYQGCNNSAAGCDYKDLLLALFGNYRELFNSPNLPFFVIGLACYDGDKGNNFDFSYVRESQAKACDADDNAYFISTCDNGDPTFIHPSAKHYIAERVSKSISSVVYKMNYYATGPSYRSHRVDGSRVIIELNNAEGLRSIGKITNFYLAGEDGKYYEAQASISDNKIIASSDKVTDPVYIKYGFGKSPFVTIVNKDNFAITPFRTDEYNTNIDLFDYNSTNKYYFHPDGSKMNIAINNGALSITKTDDGKGYGSVRLDKWGAIIYEPQGFSFTIKGTNSGASIAIRFIEGESYEIWGYKIVDDFTGEKNFTITAGDLSVLYNKQNNIFNPQCISYVEIMVEAPHEAKFDLIEARFIKVEKGAPLNYTISSVTENDDDISITLSKALFALDYEVNILNASGEVIFAKKQSDTSFSAPKSLFAVGSPYYINAKATNEIGETEALNNGFVFYLKDDSKVIVCNFDFKDQAALDAYIASSMSVHAGLTCTLYEGGVKIDSAGQGWQQFIFKLETGIASGMTKLVFTGDFSHYNGTVVMQLADTNWGVYQYNLDIKESPSGTYVLEFKDFLKSGTPFTTQTLMWVMFNFNDTTGNGYILLDDVSLLE